MAAFPRAFSMPAERIRVGVVVVVMVAGEGVGVSMSGRHRYTHTHIYIHTSKISCSCSGCGIIEADKSCDAVQRAVLLIEGDVSVGPDTTQKEANAT